MLNVSSLEWLDVSKAAVEGGNKWTHQVAVIVPPEGKLKIRNFSVAYLTGGCNNNPSVPKNTDEDIVVADTIAANIGAVAIVVFQIPNCPYIYPSDPSKKKRSEDSMIAWAWNEYLHDPAKNPEWFPRFPMAKAGMQCMRAAQDFLLKVQTFVVADIYGLSPRNFS
jgi:PhoPQ-activated pathogenicity-related protein